MRNDRVKKAEDIINFIKYENTRIDCNELIQASKQALDVMLAYQKIPAFFDVCIPLQKALKIDGK